jgi:hypothetical protein
MRHLPPQHQPTSRESENPSPTAIKVLKTIARGKLANGRPLSAEDTRQMARVALVEMGIDW